MVRDLEGDVDFLFLYARYSDAAFPGTDGVRPARNQEMRYLGAP